MAVLPVLPAPPEKYDPLYEAVRNREIQRILASKLDRVETGVYGGVPVTYLSGTANPFSVPTGATPTKVPWNTVVYDTDPYVTNDPINFNVNVTFDMAMGHFISLVHPASSGGSIDVSLFFYKNNVQVAQADTTLSRNKTWTFYATFFILPTMGVYDMRMSHTGTQPLTVDMTKSRWNFARFSPLPRAL